jgi:hypothetical protein
MNKIYFEWCGQEEEGCDYEKAATRTTETFIVFIRLKAGDNASQQRSFSETENDNESVDVDGKWKIVILRAAAQKFSAIHPLDLGDFAKKLVT